MVVTKASKRYASALLSLASDRKVVEAISSDVIQLADLFRNTRELLLFFRSPVISREKKEKAVLALFKNKLSDLMVDFLVLLTSKGRESEIPAICVAYLQMLDVHNGVLRGEVTTAFEMPKSQLDQLENALSSKTGKKVVLTSVSRPEIMGGAMIKIEDTVIDGSVANKLEKLKLNLLQPLV